MLALVGTVGGLLHAAGAWGPQWGPMGETMLHYLCCLPPLVCTRAKWQCVATRGQGGAEALQGSIATMGGLPHAAGVERP